jgi:hypothetical protein
VNSRCFLLNFIYVCTPLKVIQKDMIWNTCLSLANLIEDIGHPINGMLKVHQNYLNTCLTCTDDFHAAMESIEEAMTNFLKDATNQYFLPKGSSSSSSSSSDGLCYHYLEERNVKNVFSKMDHHGEKCPVLKIYSDGKSFSLFYSILFYTLFYFIIENFFMYLTFFKHL